MRLLRSTAPSTALLVWSAAIVLTIGCTAAGDPVGTGGSATTSSASSATSGAGGLGGSGGSGGDHGMPSDAYPAFHPSPPLVTKAAGSIVTTPKVVPVFFAGDDALLTSKVAEFLSAVGTSAYWSATTSEYGVGPLTSSAPVTLTAVLPAAEDDNDLSAWLRSKLNADDPSLPPADGKTAYVLTLPAGKSVTLNGETSCQNFGGYHSSFTLDANHGNVVVPYVVLPRCPGYKGMGPVDALTAVVSHELVETVIDPQPFADPAYRILDGAHGYWIWATGGEAADMCSPQSDPYTKPAGLDFMVARSWSNQAASALHDPCVPVSTATAYFNTAPVLPDTHQFSLAGVTYQASVVRIAVGETRDVELDLFSDGATGGPWKIQIDDYAKLYGGPLELAVTLDRDTGVNGEKVYASITPQKAASPAHGGMSFFMIRSVLGTKKTLWVGAVANK